jgi:hypothetical protein
VRDGLWRNARAVPSLDLRFADNKSLTDAVTGASLVTFTRASSGTYIDSAGVIQTATTDVPRFDHNPTTLESLGLLVEEQRTNLLVQSENLTTTWINNQSTNSADTAVAPNGTTTADSLIENSAAGVQHSVGQLVTVAANTLHTASVFVKANTRASIRFGLLDNILSSGAFAHFNAATGVISAQTTAGTATSVSYSIEPYANGWYRCRVSCVIDALSATAAVFIGLVDGSNNATYTGDGASGIYLWGAQLEAGAFPTSYIPTTTAAVTRSADVCSITGSAFSSWYRQDEGTVFAEHAKNNNLAGSRVFTLSDGTSGNQIRITASVGTAIRPDWQIVVGGVVQANVVDAPQGAVNSIMKSAGSYAADRFALAIAGTLGTVDTSGTVPTISQINLGANEASISVFNGTLRRFAFWPHRLPDISLQTVTQ